jgi:hypothetical protein
MARRGQTNPGATYCKLAILFGNCAASAQLERWHADRMARLVNNDRGACMRAFGRGLILAALLCASAPSLASAAALLNGVNGQPCDGLVSDLTVSHCSLFDIDPLAVDPLNVSFENVEDVALFRFVVTGTATFSATSTDGLLGLFDVDTDGDTPELNSVSYFDPVEDAVVTAEGFGSLGSDTPIPVGDSTSQTYILALIGADNFFGSSTSVVGLDSLLAAFSLDDPEFHSPCVGSCDITLTLSVFPDEEQPAPIPEPGTLLLIGTGMAAALVRSRKKKLLQYSPLQ